MTRAFGAVSPPLLRFYVHFPPPSQRPLIFPSLSPPHGINSASRPWALTAAKKGGKVGKKQTNTSFPPLATVYTEELR